VDVMPNYQDDAVTLLKTMSVETAKDYGNISYEVLQPANRPNHLTVVEEWTNEKARDDHVQAAHTRAFREAISPMQGALYDERLYNKGIVFSDTHSLLN
jgi:quinol monooxygenase YgiN